MLTAAELARMKATALGMLTERCDLQQEVESVGMFGSPSHTYETVGVNVACRLIRGGQQREAAEVVEQEMMRETYRLILPLDVTIGADMRVIVWGETGGTFEVVSVQARLTDKFYNTVTIRRVVNE